ncbi:four helix bundle protein [Flaviaesturariibacter terrae]
MTRKELEERTRKFHIDVIRLCRELPKDAAEFETGKQLIRAAGSVGANYRASRRAKSAADFQYKITIVLEECDEAHYWLGVVRDTGMIVGAEIDRLTTEAEELTRIFSASERTVKERRAAK